MDIDLIELCRLRGLRITGQRRIIAETIAASRDHPDAQELHRRAEKRDPTIAVSTVYRTLKLFAELGVVERHSFEGGRARIESAMTVHHDHLIDEETGKVIEFRSAEIEALQLKIASDLGYELTGHRLELYGKKRPSNLDASTRTDGARDRGR